MLRASFCPPQGNGAPKQTILSAAAVTFELPSSAESGGTAALQRGCDGHLSLAEGLSLQHKWRQAANAPFDLYNEPLIRIRVRIADDMSPFTPAAGLAWPM